MIPGHGGIMDRFDCQFLMASFLKLIKIEKKTTTFNKNLSYPTGYLCQCVHFQLHTHCITRKTSPTGTEYLTNRKFIQRQLIFSNILFSTI